MAWFRKPLKKLRFQKPMVVTFTQGSVEASHEVALSLGESKTPCRFTFLSPTSVVSSVNATTTGRWASACSGDTITDVKVLDWSATINSAGMKIKYRHRLRLDRTSFIVDRHDAYVDHDSQDCISAVIFSFQKQREKTSWKSFWKLGIWNMDSFRIAYRIWCIDLVDNCSSSSIIHSATFFFPLSFGSTVFFAWIYAPVLLSWPCSSCWDVSNNSTNQKKANASLQNARTSSRQTHDVRSVTVEK